MAAGAKKHIVVLVPKKIVLALKRGWQGFRWCRKWKWALQIMAKASLIRRVTRSLVGFSFLHPEVQAICSLSPQLRQPRQTPINHSKYCWFVLLLKEEPTDPLGQEGRKTSLVSGQVLGIGLRRFISYLTQRTTKQKHSRLMLIKHLYFRKLWEVLLLQTPTCILPVCINLLILHWASGPIMWHFTAPRETWYWDVFTLVSQSSTFPWKQLKENHLRERILLLHFVKNKPESDSGA